LQSSGRTTQQSQLLINNPNSIVTKLINKGWLERVSEEDKKKLIEKVSDGRSRRRTYIKSTNQPLIDYFKDQISFEKNEERQFNHLLEKKSFRPVFSWENGFRSFANVQDLMIQLVLWQYISFQYTIPHRLKKGEISKTNEKEFLSNIIRDITKKRNEIAERILPELRIQLSSNVQNEYSSFMDDINDKLKPPLSLKFISLAKNTRLLFEMIISTLACGEFMAEFQKNKYSFVGPRSRKR